MKIKKKKKEKKKVLQNKQSNCLQHFPGIYGKDLVIAHPTGGGSGGIFLGCMPFGLCVGRHDASSVLLRRED